MDKRNYFSHYQRDYEARGKFWPSLLGILALVLGAGLLSMVLAVTFGTW